MNNRQGRSLRARLCASVAIGAMTIASAGVAAQDQDSDDEGFTLEEIMVTAQKRAKTLQDVPIAVSAYTGETLSQSSTRDIRDLMQLVPALNTTQAAASFQTVVNIRGIGTSGFNPGLEPSVGIYVDGVYRSRTGSAIGDFVSVERVEVLRGPQSTLFGKNTSAGVISFVTKKPEYEFGGQVEATYGNYDQMVLKGTVTGPISEDKAAFRLSANFNKRDGFVTNVANGDDVNDRDRWAIRGQLLLEPSDDLSIRIIGDYSTMDEACCAAPFLENGPTRQVAALLGENLLTTDPFQREVSFNGEMLNSMDDAGISAEITYDMGSVEFTSITAYRDFQSDANFDADFMELDIIKRNGEETNVNTFTQEIRFQSTGDNTIDWLVGAFYSDQSLDAEDKVPYGADMRAFFDIVGGFGSIIPGVSNLTGLELLTQSLAAGGLPIAALPTGSIFTEETGLVSELFETKSSSYALFGQFDWHLSDRLTLTAGLRYTNEDKDAKATFDIRDDFSALNFLSLRDTSGAPDLTALINAATFGGLLGAGFTPAQALGTIDALIDTPGYNAFAPFAALQFFRPRNDFDRSRSEDKWTGNVILAYDLSEDLNTYASFSRGYKAGGFDTSRAAATNDPNEINTFEFDPEVVDAWELGFKARLLEGRGRMNVALYSQKVSDFQSNLFNGLGFDLRNAGDIRIKGFEIDAQFALTEDFTWSFASAYSDAKYITFVNGPCRIDDPRTVCDLSGERLADAPKWTISSSANYNIELNENLSAFVRGDIFYRGKRNVAGDNDPHGDMDGTFIVNASLGLMGGDDSPWRASFWVKNLTNENYLQLIFDSVAQAGSFNGYPSDPRTYGLTVSLDF